MSWSYLLERAGEFTVVYCSDTLPYAPSKFARRTWPSCCSGRKTASCPPSPSGMTCALSTEAPGAALSTSCQEDSPALTSASQERAPASTADSPGCGPKWRASFATFDPDSCLWRTAQRSLFADSAAFLAIWPRSGMTADGHAYLQPPAERHTSATESGFSLIPTPRANDSEKLGNFDHMNKRNGLPAFARRFPTPTVRDSRTAKGAKMLSSSQRAECLAVFVATADNLGNGRLNPTFVEWLMGWPIGSTGFSPLEMAKFHEFMLQHGATCPLDCSIQTE